MLMLLGLHLNLMICTSFPFSALFLFLFPLVDAHDFFGSDEHVFFNSPISDCLNLFNLGEHRTPFPSTWTKSELFEDVAITARWWESAGAGYRCVHDITAGAATPMWGRAEKSAGAQGRQRRGAEEDGARRAPSGAREECSVERVGKRERGSDGVRG